MCVVGSRSSWATLPTLQRVRGRVQVDAVRRDEQTRLGRLHQSGAGKCLLPGHPGPVLEAVLLNTAGGITGGDRLEYECWLAEGAQLVATSQAAERVYRSTGDDGTVDTRLALGAGARLAWLPQETIVFNGGRLRRRLDVDMAPDAILTALEPMVLGRRAMGETVRRGLLSDQWRIRRGGRLVYADALRLTAPIDDTLSGLATGAGARAFATLVHVAPNAESRLEEVRELLAGQADVNAAASSWDGLLCVRFLTAEGRALRRALTAFLSSFLDTPLPRVWSL